MPEHKNQHYVPRAHLRPFSVDGEGHAINLHLVRAGRPVFGAPVRGQCARPWFYGADGAVENSLGRLETIYAEVVRRVSRRDHPVGDEDRYVLRYFILLQSLRTRSQIGRALEQARRMASFHKASLEAHGEVWDARDDPDLNFAMMLMFEAFNDLVQAGAVDDLKVVVVRNLTRRAFVTCDDPAVMTNRWLLQRKRIRTFGTNAAGLVLLLPLTPTLLAMCYDPAVYTVQARDGYVRCEREGDAAALNAHQHMRAVDAIYFARETDAGAIAADFEAARAFRPPSWESFTVASRDGGDDAHDRYRAGPMDEVAKADDQLLHMAREFPSPPRWPSFLRFRHDAHGFTLGRVVKRRSFATADAERWSQYRKVV